MLSCAACCEPRLLSTEQAPKNSRGQKEVILSLDEMLKMYPKTWAYLMDQCHSSFSCEEVRKGGSTRCKSRILSQSMEASELSRGVKCQRSLFRLGWQ